MGTSVNTNTIIFFRSVDDEGVAHRNRICRTFRHHLASLLNFLFTHLHFDSVAHINKEVRSLFFIKSAIVALSNFLAINTHLRTKGCNSV